MLEESWLVWRLVDQVPVVAHCGLLKRLVRLGVLVGVGVSLGVVSGEDSFFICWEMTNVVFYTFDKIIQMVQIMLAKYQITKISM